MIALNTKQRRYAEGASLNLVRPGSRVRVRIITGVEVTLETVSG